MPNWDSAVGEADGVEQLQARRMKASAAVEAPSADPAKARPKSSPRMMKAELAVKRGMDQRQADRMVALQDAEERAYTLGREFNALSFAAEEKQQLLERLSETAGFLALVPPAAPTSPPEAKRALTRSHGKGDSKGARARSTSPTAASTGGDATGGPSQQDSAVYRDSTLADLLGDHHPTVKLANARDAVDERLVTVEPELHQQDEYSETLSMMLRRLREQHALQLASIAEMRDRLKQMSSVRIAHTAAPPRASASTHPVFSDPLVCVCACVCVLIWTGGARAEVDRGRGARRGGCDAHRVQDGARQPREEFRHVRRQDPRAQERA